MKNVCIDRGARTIIAARRSNAAQTVVIKRGGIIRRYHADTAPVPRCTTAIAAATAAWHGTWQRGDVVEEAAYHHFEASEWPREGPFCDEASDASLLLPLVGEGGADAVRAG